MIRFALKKGLRFIKDSVGWTIDKQLVNGDIRLESDDGLTEAISRTVLYARWLAKEYYIDQQSLIAGKVKFYFTAPADLSSLPPARRKYAERCQAYCNCVRKIIAEHGEKAGFRPELLDPALQEVAAEIKKANPGSSEKPPCPRNLRRWWARFSSTGSVMKVVDGRERSGRKKEDIQQEVFKEAVDEFYLTTQKERAARVVEAVQEKIRRMNQGLEPGEKPIICPSRATLYRWFDDLDAKLVHLAREGKKSTDMVYREALKTTECRRILERIEIDHSPLDVFVIDSVTKLALGRPWITIAIDRYSRAIMGFYISFRAPSSVAVLQCLRMAMFPKDAILKRFGIKGIWPCYGIMMQIATDNGMDLHSDAVEAICSEMGIEIIFCGAGKPHHKAVVERAIKTIQENLIHRLPGTTFHNIDDRGDYPSEEVPALDLETLVHCVVKWIVEQYMVKPHRGLEGCTPLRRWQESAETTVIELPAYQEEFEILIGIPEKRKLQHYGIETECLRYNSPELQRIRARIGGTPKLSIKSYEHTVEYIDVWDSDIREYLRVHAVDREYAKGLTCQMHRVIRAHTREKYGTDYSVADRERSKAEMQSMIQEAKASKKLKHRKDAAVAEAFDSQSAIYGMTELSDALQEAAAPPAFTSKSHIHNHDEDDEADESFFVPYEVETKEAA
jgi:putative transposase